MQISRERIKQLDIERYIDRCEIYREYAVKLYLYDDLKKEIVEMERELEIADTDKEKEEIREKINEAKEFFLVFKWVYISAVKEIVRTTENELKGIKGVDLLQLCDGLGLAGEHVSSSLFRFRGIDPNGKEACEIKKGVYVKQLSNDIYKKSRLYEWTYIQKAMYDEQAREFEIQRLEKKSFPVAYLITQGEVYTEIIKGRKDWNEVVKQLAELRYYKKLVEEYGEKEASKRDIICTNREIARAVLSEGGALDYKDIAISKIAKIVAAALNATGWEVTDSSLRNSLTEERKRLNGIDTSKR